MTPLRFFIDGRIGERAEGANRFTVGPDGCARELGPRRFIHERHKLIREAGHCAADTDAAYIRAAADSGHPSALGHIAVHNRTPAAKLYDALWRAVRRCKIAAFVIPS